MQVFGVDITATVDATVSNTAGSSTSTAIATFSSGNATLVKYVRNASNPAANAVGTGDKTFMINSVNSNYFRANVTGAPGDILEYVLEATNAGLVDIEKAVQTATAKHNAFLKELGLPRLP